MKIITGTARGTPLQSPADQSIRPTAARVKEAMFSMIQFDLPDAHVLDLFAGSGQLGLEALSRGAKHCDFVDKSRSATELVGHNLKQAKLEGGMIYNFDAVHFLQQHTQDKAFDIILIDPPYDLPNLDEILQTIQKLDILRPSGIMVCETAADTFLPTFCASYSIRRQNRYGQTQITVWQREGETP